MSAYAEGRAYFRGQRELHGAVCHAYKEIAIQGIFALSAQLCA